MTQQQKPQQWYANVNGVQYGPFDVAQMRGMAAEGRVGPEDLVWAEGMASWTPAKSVGGLYGQAVPVAPIGAPAPAAALHYYGPPGPGAGVCSLPDDPGPFEMVGKATVAGWTGRAAASPLAFYFVKVARAQNSHFAYGGGLFGALLSEAFKKPDADVRTCSLAELPAGARDFLDPKGKLAARDVVVLPKGAVRLVKFARVNNQYTVTAGADAFPVTTGMFSKGKARQTLAQMGWTLDQEVMATAPPIHGASFGRSDPSEVPTGPSRGRRLLYVVIAILILVAVIWLQVYLADQR